MPKAFEAQILSLFFLFTACLFSFSAQADLASGNCTPAQSQTSQVVTQHTTMINGKSVIYTATVGYIEITSNDQSSKACVFYTAYTVAPSAGEKPRPLTFAFNGGPGSASVWLHLGLLGPKRVDMGLDGLRAPAQNILIQNESSFLDLTDIVMIDPVATGFSHTENGANNNQFFGVLNDYTSIEAFIQKYLNANDRWMSPKYVIGESYGGVRGSLLANHLQNDLNISLNGLILISPELSDTSLSYQNIDNNVPFVVQFPSMAATAWYHHTIAQKYQSLSVEQIFSLAQKFANTVLRDALDAGDNLDQAQFEQVAQQVSELTGVNVDLVKQNNLKLTTYFFFENALASRNLMIGRYDSRFTAVKVDSPRSGYNDPSGSLTAYPFTAGINQYLRVDLNWQSASPYNIFGNITEWPSDPTNPNTEVITDLGQALSENPSMRLFVANGYFDFACSMGSADYELSQIPGGHSFTNRITHNRYVGGHMMYINPDALHQLKADLTLFITNSQTILRNQY